MRLMAVLILLLLATGCNLFETQQSQPVVQPQPVIQQPTDYITQYDYKAGPIPSYNNNPTPQPDPNKDLATGNGLPGYSITISAGGGSGGGSGFVPYIPQPGPVSKNLYSGTVVLTISK